MNIQKGFKDCGIHPLSLETLLRGIIGDAPGASTRTPPIVLKKAVEITPRQERTINRLGFSPDEVRVHSFNLELLCTRNPRRALKLGERDWLKGGILMSSEDMIEELQKQKDEKDLKEKMKIEKKEQIAKRKEEAKEKKKKLEEERELKKKKREELKAEKKRKAEEEKEQKKALKASKGENKENVAATNVGIWRRPAFIDEPIFCWEV